VTCIGACGVTCTSVGNCNVMCKGGPPKMCPGGRSVCGESC
jgi:hypothetical protein